MKKQIEKVGLKNKINNENEKKKKNIKTRIESVSIFETYILTLT